MSPNQKIEFPLAYQKCESNRYKKVVEEDASQNKRWLKQSHFLSQNNILAFWQIG